ncbi:MAG TPA: hypothetical protein PLL06_02670, partial [Acidobacteriota bacterium]|nr:hypothetical protein [Acidobacteriota bacterium]
GYDARVLSQTTRAFGSEVYMDGRAGIHSGHMDTSILSGNFGAHHDPWAEEIRKIAGVKIVSPII